MIAATFVILFALLTICGAFLTKFALDLGDTRVELAALETRLSGIHVTTASDAVNHEVRLTRIESKLTVVR